MAQITLYLRYLYKNDIILACLALLWLLTLYDFYLDGGFSNSLARKLFSLSILSFALIILIMFRGQKTTRYTPKEEDIRKYFKAIQ